MPAETDKGKQAIDQAKPGYEAKTKNGKTQSNVGGTNVRLTCPPPPATPAQPPTSAPGKP